MFNLKPTIMNNDRNNDRDRNTNNPNMPNQHENDTTRQGTGQTGREHMNTPGQGGDQNNPSRHQEGDTTQRTQERGQDTINQPEQDEQGQRRNDPFKPEQDNTRSSI
jgi:hypothetical protein